MDGGRRTVGSQNQDLRTRFTSDLPGVEMGPIEMAKAGDLEDRFVLEDTRFPALATACRQRRRYLPHQSGEGSHRCLPTVGSQSPLREGHDPEEMTEQESGGREILPDQRREVLQEEGLDDRFVPQTQGRAAMLVMDPAAWRQDRWPTSLPCPIAEVDVLDVDRREDTLVEPTQGQKTLPIVGRRPASGEEDGVI